MGDVRALVAILACLVLVACGLRVNAEALGYGTGVLVRGGGNTLATIARDVADPDLFSFDNGRAVCAGAFTLTGDLTIQAGESLLFRNAQQEFGRRLVYLLGRMDFSDCEIAGAYWIVVGPQASGTWRNVRIISGPNGDSGYPLLYFNSSDLRWEGGLVDAHPAPDIFSRFALSSRGGYHPGSVANTIRGVTIRAREFAFYDPPTLGVNVDLTFEGCVFETSGDDRAMISTYVNACDLGRTRVVLRDCRRVKGGQPAAFDEIGVYGSTGEAVEVSEGNERRHQAEQLTSVKDEPPAGIRLRGRRSFAASADEGVWRRLSHLPALHHRIAEYGGDARLRGSMYMPQYWLDLLRRIRISIGANERYGPGDTTTVTSIMDLLEDTLDKAPLAAQPGTPYHPRPAKLDPPPPGRAHVEMLADGRVQVDTYGSRLFYSPGGPGKYARMTEDSIIRGRRVFDAYPGDGGPSLRTLAPSDSSLMLWEQPWRVEIVQNDSPIVGFKTILQNAARYGAEVTEVFFYDLPDVILFDAASVQREAPPTAASVRFAAYATVAHKSYNGIRFWSEDPQGVDSLANPTKETIAAGEPEHGLFVGRLGNFWMYPHLARGALVAQWNGYNDWRSYPPAGYIIRKDECAAIYENVTGYAGGYYAHVVQLHKPPRTRYRLLWFEGRGLRCWENIFNLDDAFNRPCEVSLTLAPGKPLQVEAVETAGLQRNIEIVILPRVFGALKSELAVFRGDSTIMLLRDMAPGSRRPLGSLPVTLSSAGAGRFEVVSALDEPLPEVEIRLRAAEGAARVRHGNQQVERFERRGGAITYRAPVVPGRTEVTIE